MSIHQLIAAGAQLRALRSPVEALLMQHADVTGFAMHPRLFALVDDRPGEHAIPPVLACPSGILP